MLLGDLSLLVSWGSTPMIIASPTTGAKEEGQVLLGKECTTVMVTLSLAWV